MLGVSAAAYVEVGPRSNLGTAQRARFLVGQEGPIEVLFDAARPEPNSSHCFSQPCFVFTSIFQKPPVAAFHPRKMLRKTIFSPGENEIIEQFLSGTPTDDETRDKRKFERVWWGESEFKRKDVVKNLARGEGEKSAVAWNPSGKLWGTHSLAAVANLIASRNWRPDCVPSDLFSEIEKRARERTKAEDGAGAAKRKRSAEECHHEPVASSDHVPLFTTRTFVETRTTMRECPECMQVPLLQFLECGCTKDQMQWKICRVCDVSFHPTKLPGCLCY